MRRTVPSRCDGPDGNCGRLVGRQAAEPQQRNLARGRPRRPARREPAARDTRGSDRLRARIATGPFVAGFDFSFGLPEWFAREHGCATIDDVWALAARDGERWLAPDPAVLAGALRRPAASNASGRCEDALSRRAKSIFQLVGNGQVGAGSVRGMPLLARLRAAGHRDLAVRRRRASAPSFEIYPSALRKHSPHRRRDRSQNEHERDAVVLGARDVGRTRNGRGVERRDRSDHSPRGRYLGAYSAPE